jgi:uncharacterized surface protein with fasciclin (FAS1) repeats
MAEKRNLLEVLKNDYKFEKLVSVITAAGMEETFSTDGPYTIYAPSDKAFEKMPKETLESLFKPENKEELVGILKYHMVAGRVNSNDVAKLSKQVSLNGAEIRIDSSNTLKIQGAGMNARNIDATNGIIHVIDEVLSPVVATPAASTVVRAAIV